MQAILLLEYFARFRGRKAVTKPSKLFESLYSRVSSLQFFAASSSLPIGPPNDNGLWLVDTSAWSSASPSASEISSCDSVTPTAPATLPSYVVQPAPAIPNNPPWDSFPSSYASSTSSSFGNLPSSPISFAPEDTFPSNSSPAIFNVNDALPHAPSSSGAQRSWSSLFSPGRYNPPLASSLSFPMRSQAAEQTYSQALSTLQVLYQNPAMFDSTILDADQHLPAEERWPNWFETEARRRLLAGCFLLDGHASLYHQSWRAHDFDSSGMTPSPPVPLFGRSASVWAASSAEEWATILAADPGAGIPAFALPSEQLTPEYVMAQTPFDRMGILGVEMLRLPRPQPATSGSTGSSPAPEVSHSGSQLGADQQLRHLHSGGHQPDGTQEALSADVEERISKLFAKCPTGNTYLALHHTPLHDLLAVSGDSWVFSQKVLPVTSFLEHQKRLKLWSEQHSRLSSASSVGGIGSLSAAKATVYAARAILGFLEREQSSPYSGSSWSADLSDYWALYVCALICWAFGHRARPAPAADARQNHHYHHQHQRSSSAGSGTYSPASRLSTSAAAAADEGALGWLRMIAADNMRLEDVVRVRARREAAGVVGLVLRRLESDCVGGRSRLYVDAVGVLRKLEEGANWKWF